MSFANYDWEIRYRPSRFGTMAERLARLVMLPPLQGEAQSRLVSELVDRLPELEFLRDELGAAQQEAHDAMRRSLPGSVLTTRASAKSATAGAQLSRIAKFINLEAKAIYLIADLVIMTVRDINKIVFGREKVIKEPRGILTIRNHLITHPRRGRNIIVQGFTIEQDGRGVRLLGWDEDGSAVDDPGIEANIDELLEFLTRWIDRFEADFEYPWDRDARVADELRED